MPINEQQQHLSKRLLKQAVMMEENAELMRVLFPDVVHGVELSGAANITRQWVDSLEAGEWGIDNGL
jgi:hypothetical protein